jgi:hypothetical protein
MAVGSLLAAAAFGMALRIGARPSYLLDVLPVALLLGLGLACAVAPLTAAVLAAAPVQLAGAASGINNATARSAGLLAIAIVPAVSGLSGTGIADATAFSRGYRTAMLIAAGLLLVAALVSWFGVGASPPGAQAVEPAPAPDVEPLVPVHRNYSCPVTGQPWHPPPLHPAQPRHTDGQG